MQTDEKPWLRSGDAPFHNYFLERIWKRSSCHRGPGKKFDGDCRKYHYSLESYQAYVFLCILLCILAIISTCVYVCIYIYVLLLL